MKDWRGHGACPGQKETEKMEVEQKKAMKDQKKYQ